MPYNNDRVPSNMESSSSKKSDDRLPRRPGYLEKSRLIPFRDDTSLEYSALERRRSELTDKLNKNNKELQELLKESNAIERFNGVLKQKDDLTFIGELNRLKKALELPNEAPLDMEGKLGKSRAFLDTLKTKGMTTQELEGHLNSLKTNIQVAKDFISFHQRILNDTNDTQESVNNLKKDYPSIAFNREIKKEKVYPIKSPEQSEEVQDKIETHFTEIALCNKNLQELDIPVHPQKAARLFQKRLYHEESCARLCEVLSQYQLEKVSSDFKIFLGEVEDDIKKIPGLTLQELSIDEKSLNKRKEEMNQHLNTILKEVGLGSSRKLSQAERIAKAEKSLKSKHFKINEDIQKIRRENENLQKEFDQLEKTAHRYNPHLVENHHEEQRDMIQLLSEGGLESIKVVSSQYFRAA